MTISTLLVANRGEIARRIFRTCRQMGISTVAIYSDPDAGEPHAREADVAIPIIGAEAGETYLDIDAVLSAATRAGADAVHPGYGFLSENPRFARAVLEAGLVWIGPSPESIRVMGSKLESKRLMETAGVPVLPGFEAPAGVEPEEIAERVGYPLLVKASSGGGGKGMRVVLDPAALDDAVDGARREAAAAFGDDTILLERYLEAPRHVEVQVFGDRHGHVISLYERECSIQRRHQKIIEESPSPALGPETRRAMGEAAVAAAKAVDYQGAGTVEFLFAEGDFYFLEMNTRLQVEHPVTEMVTGLDLVRLQIEVADGGHVPDPPPPITGHAIEARLYAEDPTREFLPVTGVFHHVSFPDIEGLRVDSGIESGSRIGVHYDPMIAKVVAHATTRELATAKLSKALRRARLHGSTTNRALLVRVLEHPEFAAGRTDTHFLQRHDPALLGRPLLDGGEEWLAAVAAALADQAHERSEATVLTTVPSGWRNLRSAPQERSYEGEHGAHTVRYWYDREGLEVEGLGRLSQDEVSPSRVRVHTDHGPVDFMVARHGPERHLDSEKGPARLVELPRYPSTLREDRAGSLHAPMPGRIIRIAVAEGDEVAEGQVLLVMEAMKMEHTLRSPQGGRVVEIRRSAGDQVESGAVLVVVEEA